MDKVKAVIKKIWPYLLIAIVGFSIAAFFEYNHSFETEVTGQVNLTTGTYHIYANLNSPDIVAWELFDIDENDGNNQWGRSIGRGICDTPGIIDGKFEIVDDYNHLALGAYNTNGEIIPIIEMPYHIEMITNSYIDWYVIGLIVSILLGLIYYWIIKRKWWNCVIIVVSAILIIPFLSTRLPYGHDLYFHIGRIQGIKIGLETGQFPVHNNPAFNYGYGFLDPIYYPNLFLYIPALLCMAGMSIVNAYKVFLFTVNVATGFVGYYGFKLIFEDDKKSYIASILWLTNPYRLINIYLRAAVGEYLAQVFIPLFFGALIAIIYHKKNRWIALAIGASGILQSHILSVEMTAIMAVLLVILSIKTICQNDIGRILKNTLIAMLTTIIVNIWFVIPFIRRYFSNGRVWIEYTNAAYVGHGAKLWQLFELFPKMTGESAIWTTIGDMPFTIGISLAVGLALFLIILINNKAENEKVYIKITSVCAILGIVSIILTTKWFSYFISGIGMIYNILKNIQFPWRFCGYASFFLTIVLAFALKYIYEKWDNTVLKRSMIVLLCILHVATLMSCIISANRDIGSLLSSREMNQGALLKNDYLEVDMDTNAMQYRKDVVVADEDVIIYNYLRNGSNISFDYECAISDGKSLVLPLYAFEGYLCVINGEKTEMGYNQEKLITIQLPKGINKGHIEVKYEG